jgi:hypothetical protein
VPNFEKKCQVLRVFRWSAPESSPEVTEESPPAHPASQSSEIDVDVPTYDLSVKKSLMKSLSKPGGRWWKVVKVDELDIHDIKKIMNHQNTRRR